MSTIQRRNSQRLASALEALSSDLVVPTSTEVTTAEDMKTRAAEYVKKDVEGRQYDPIAYLGSDQTADFDAAVQELQKVQDDIPQDNIPQEQEYDNIPQKQEYDNIPQEQDNIPQEQDNIPQEQDNIPKPEKDGFDQAAFQSAISQASIEQGDPGVSEFGSQSTNDCNDVVSLGDEYGVDFNGDEDLQPTIRKVPGRAQKQAKIKKLIARIQNVANHLEKTGRKKLAYRLDVVCNNLEKKYSIK